MPSSIVDPEELTNRFNSVKGGKFEFQLIPFIYATDTQATLKLIHEVMELLGLIMTEQNHKVIIKTLFRELEWILKNYEPQFQHNEIHKIRNLTLELIQNIPIQENLKEFVHEIVQTLIQTIDKDNEINAVIAIKSLFEIQKYFKRQIDVKSEYYMPFLQFCCRLYSNFRDNARLKFQIKPGQGGDTSMDDDSANYGRGRRSTRNQPATQQSEPPAPVSPPYQETEIPRGDNSFKVVSSSGLLLLLINQIFATEEEIMNFFKQLIPIIIEGLEYMPSRAEQLAHKQTFLDYLEAIKFIISHITFMLRSRSMPDRINQKSQTITNAIINILENCPSFASIIRKEVIQAAKHLHHNLDKTSFSQHLDKLLNLQTLLGKGKLNKDLIYYTNVFLINFILFIREMLDFHNLKKSVKILINSISDPRTNVNLKGTQFYIIAKLLPYIKEKTPSEEKFKKILVNIFVSIVQTYKDCDRRLPRIIQVYQQQQNEEFMQRQQVYLSREEFFDNEEMTPEEKEVYELSKSWQQSENAYSNKSNEHIDLGILSDNSQLSELSNELCQKLIKYSIPCTTQIVQNLYFDPSSRSKNLTKRDMNLIKKFLRYGLRILKQYLDLCAIIPGSQNDLSSEDFKNFVGIFQKLPQHQFRDVIQDQFHFFFDTMIKAYIETGDKGLYQIVTILIETNSENLPPPGQPGQQNPNQGQNQQLGSQNQHVIDFIELMLKYLIGQIKYFGNSVETYHPLYSHRDKIQRTLVDLLHTTVDKALQRDVSCPKLKNLVQSIIVYSIEFARVSEHFPNYFQVLKNMVKTFPSVQSNEFCKEFTPYLQGLLEILLKVKEEMHFLKEINEISLTMPARLKNLIEYLPLLTKPLLDSLKAQQIELILSGIRTLEHWIGALTPYPEILDPVISPILPELNTCLYKILYLLPPFSFKILGKLGHRTRVYYEEKEFRSKNYPDDGLKIILREKFSGKEMVVGLENAIDVAMLKIFDSAEKFSEDKLAHAFKFLQSCFITYIPSGFSPDYIQSCIEFIKSKPVPEPYETPISNLTSSAHFDGRKRQKIRASATHRNCENHTFEKILRTIFLASTLQKSFNENIYQKSKQFLKFISRHMTLIYIAKNGSLQQCLINEVNPLIFLDIICDFLYMKLELFNNQPTSSTPNPSPQPTGPQQSTQQQSQQKDSSPKNSVRSYSQGSLMAVKQMLKFINEIFSSNVQAMLNLEIIHLLIKKICHLSYHQDMPKREGSCTTLQLIMEYMPKEVFIVNYKVIIQALFALANSMPESIQVQPQNCVQEDETIKTIRMFFEKVEFFLEEDHMTDDNNPLQMLLPEALRFSLNTLWTNLLSPKKQARQCAQKILTMYIEDKGIEAQDLLRRAGSNTEKAIFDEIQQKKHLYAAFYDGYSKIQDIISVTDCLSFLIKHKVFVFFELPHTYHQRDYSLFKEITLQVQAILEREIEMYDDILFNLVKDTQNKENVQKYVYLEKTHIQKNNSYDAYAQSKYPHRLLTDSNFEEDLLTKVENMRTNKGLTFEPPDFSVIDIQSNLEQIRDSQKRKTESYLEMFSNTKAKKVIESMTTQQCQEYDSHLYELFPNHRMHTELIMQLLDYLVTIMIQPHVHQFIVRDRQQLVMNVRRQPDNSTYRKEDFNLVDIRNKTIIIFFKMFLREENCLIRKSKECLRKLLQLEQNSQEVFPDVILKECVRPALQILQAKQVGGSQYKILKRMIKVLSQCFNDQLCRHLLKTLDQLKTHISHQINVEEFQRQLDSQRNAQQSSENDSTHESVNDEYKQQQTQMYIQKEFQKKQEMLDISANIVQVFYLLTSYRELIEELVPLVIKLEELSVYYLQGGYLRSSFRTGLAKFLNKYPLDSTRFFLTNYQEKERFELFLEVLKMKSSFSLRERISREFQSILMIIKERQAQEHGLELVYILQKFIPKWITYNPEVIRQICQNWESLMQTYGDQDRYLLNSKVKKRQEMLIACLITYCRQNHCDVEILGKLIALYEEQSPVDYSGMRDFLKHDIGKLFTMHERGLVMRYFCQEISKSTLQVRLEQKYFLFELLINPMLQETASRGENKLEDLVKPYLDKIVKVLVTDQQIVKEYDDQIDPMKVNLSIDFLIMEILKLLSLFLEHLSQETLRPYQNNLIPFFWAQLKSEYPAVKQWSYYGISFLIKKFKCRAENLREVYSGLITEFPTSAANHQYPMFYIPSSENKSLIKLSISNVMEVIEKQQNEGTISFNPTDVLQIAINFEGRVTSNLMHLCEIIINHEEMFYKKKELFVTKLTNAVQRLATPYNVPFQQRKVAVDISEVLIKWGKRCKEQDTDYQSLFQRSDNQNQSVNEIILYYLIRTSLMIYFGQETAKEVNEISFQSLLLIREAILIWNDTPIHFPFFQKLISQNQSESEHDILVKMTLLNVFNMLLKHKERNYDLKDFFLEFIRQTTFKFHQCIDFSSKIVAGTIKSLNVDDDSNKIFNRIIDIVEKDLHNTYESFRKEYENLRQQQQNNQNQQQQTRAKEQILYDIIPHFSARILMNLLDTDLESQEQRLFTRFITDLDRFFEVVYRVIYVPQFTEYFQLQKYITIQQHKADHEKEKQESCQQKYKNRQKMLCKDIDIVNANLDQCNLLQFNKTTLLYSIKTIGKYLHYLQPLTITLYIKSLEHLINLCNDEQFLLEVMEIYQDIILYPQVPTKIKLNQPQTMKQKFAYLVNLFQKILSGEKQEQKIVLEAFNVKVYELANRFISSLHTGYTEELHNFIDYVFLSLKNRDYQSRKFFFSLLDNIFGQDLSVKFKHFICKLAWNEKTQELLTVSQFLDLILYNCIEDADLKKDHNSLMLNHLNNVEIDDEDTDFSKDDTNDMEVKYDSKCSSTLSAHFQQIKEYKKMKILDLLDPLREITHIDPGLSDKLWCKLFPQIWQIFPRSQQQQLSYDLESFMYRLVQHTQSNKRNSNSKTVLESVLTCIPQPKISPETMVFIAKHQHAWHGAILGLESEFNTFPNNERFSVCLAELYTKLAEDDYLAGLRKLTTQSEYTHAGISYSQHWMWEEANSIFNDAVTKIIQTESNQGIGSSSAQKNKSYFSFDPLSLTNQEESTFTKPNQLDLRVWEDLHVSTMKTLNDWELVHQIARDHTNFSLLLDYLWHKKDFNKITSSQIQLPDTNSQKLLQPLQLIKEENLQPFEEYFRRVINDVVKEWHMLPNYIDTIQCKSLILFQQIIEATEAKNMLKSVKEFSEKAEMNDLRTGINIWRERMPSRCEHINVWKDIFENRNFIYEKFESLINEKYKNNQLTYYFHDIPWNLIQIAQQARKQGIYDLSGQYLNDTEKFFKKVPEVKLYDQERFLKQCELLKLTIQSAKGDQVTTKYNTALAWIQKSIKEDDHLKPDQKAELYRLRGLIYHKQQNFEQAQIAFKQSLENFETSSKTWTNFSRLCFEKFNEAPQDSRQSVYLIRASMRAMQLKLKNSKFYIPMVFKALRLNNESPTLEAFCDYLHLTPKWVWIFWTPQLIQNLEKQSPNLKNASFTVLHELSKFYPQAIYYHLTTSDRMKHSQQTEPQKKVNDLISEITGQNPVLYQNIDKIEMEFLHNLKSSFPEELYQFLQLLLKTVKLDQKGVLEQLQKIIHSTMSNFFQKNRKDSSLSDQESQYQSDTNQQHEGLRRQLHEAFKRDFLDQNASLNELMQRIKNWKDYLYNIITLDVPSTQLQDYSTFLANFQFKGIELPGQHQIRDTEPYPEQIIYITRFDPSIFKSSITGQASGGKKIIVRANNMKAYPFISQLILSEQSYRASLTDERLMQVKSVLKNLFIRHRETLRRGVKFHQQIKIVSNSVKFVQEDLSFINMNEVYEFLLQESGVDSDIVLLLEQQSNSVTDDNESSLGQTKNQQIYKDICENYVPSHLLQSYFQRIFQNLDDFFIFKKMFTTYHGTLSFLSYILNLDDQHLDKFSFCRNSGRVSINEAQFNYSKMKEDGIILQGNPNGPFRLSNNFKQFIGDIGLKGLFSAVLTSSAMALSKKASQFQNVVETILFDEFGTNEILQKQISSVSGGLEKVVKVNSEVVMNRIHAMINPEKIVYLPEAQTMPQLKTQQSHK